MSFLVDTNVVSELFRKRPAQRVVSWLSAQAPSGLHLSVITVGEVRRGLLRLASSRRKTALISWWQDALSNKFLGQVHPISMVTMEAWAELNARCEAEGRKLPMADSLIAATAIQHGLVVVTRNVADFAPMGVAVVDPWQA